MSANPMHRDPKSEENPFKREDTNISDTEEIENEKQRKTHI